MANRISICVCRLKALTHQIKMGEKEIEECLWMPVQDFMADDDISPFNKGIVRSALGERRHRTGRHARDAPRPHARIFPA